MEKEINSCYIRLIKSGVIEQVKSLCLTVAGLSTDGASFKNPKFKDYRAEDNKSVNVFDRSYALIDKETGKYLRRSNVLKLALLGILIRNGKLYLYSGDQEFPLEESGETRIVTMKDSLIEAQTYSEGVNEFINSIVKPKKPVELAKFIGERKDESEFNIGFADNNILHVVSYQLIEFLKKIRGHDWISPKALGANLAVNTDGLFDLENAEEVSINGHKFSIVGTPRCIVPTINDKGEKSEGSKKFFEDLSTIKESYIRTNEKGLFMGGYLRSLGKLPEGGLEIREGFEFKILK